MRRPWRKPGRVQHFQLQHSAVAPPQRRKDKVEGGAKLQTILYSIVPKSFRYSNALIAKSLAQTWPFKSVTDKQTSASARRISHHTASSFEACCLSNRLYSHLASCLGFCWEPPLCQSSPKWEKLIPDSSRTSMQSYTPLSFSTAEKRVTVRTSAFASKTHIPPCGAQSRLPCPPRHAANFFPAAIFFAGAICI